MPNLFNFHMILTRDNEHPQSDLIKSKKLDFLFNYFYLSMRDKDLSERKEYIEIQRIVVSKDDYN